MTATTPTRIRCARRSTCWPGARGRPRWYWATWARSGRRGLNFIARSAAMPAAAASRACSRSAKRRRTPPRPSAKAPSISTTSRPWWRPSTRAPCSSKGRASCAWSGSSLRSPAPPKERTDAARARAMARQGRARLQRVQVHHVARGGRLPQLARGVPGARSLHDPQAHRLQDRPGGTRRRATLAPHQGRDADHGRRADPGFDLRHDAPLGRSLEQVPVGGAAGDARLRLDRLDRRLPQGGAPQSEGSVAENEILLAGADRPRRRVLPRVALAIDAAAQPADRAVLQVRGLSARHVRLHRAHVLRDRRHFQRRQPHRRPRRPGDHADGAGRQRARHLCLRRRPRSVLQVPRPAVYRGRGRAGGDLRRNGRRRPRVPVVQRLPGGSVHGRRRRARARRLARHRGGRGAPGNRALHHGRRVRRRDALGDDPGAVLQVERRQAHLPHGAAASPLRARGLEGKPGGGALLDHHHDARAVRAIDAEAAMMRESPFRLLKRPERFALAGRRVLVLGLGDTGLSVARYAEGQGARVRVADTRARPPRLADIAGDVRLGPFRSTLLAEVDLVCISPGLSLGDPLVGEALARGLPVVGDIELFAWQNRAPVLAITGTNGKSTVSALTGHLLRAAGVDAEVAGNISPPVLEAAMKRTAPPAAWVLELSSYQLETTWSLDARAASVLNLSEDHLDRYSSLAEYGAAKARVFEGDGVQVLNRDDAGTQVMARPGRSVVTFGLDAPRAPADLGVRAGTLVEGEQPIVEAAALPIHGAHNIANALAACALACALGVPRERLRDGLVSFRGLPHRLELVARRGAVEGDDDSQGTNGGGNIAAPRGLGKRAVLILGGDGKGQDFSPLREPVARYATHVLLIGRDAPLIERALAGLRRARWASLDQAVERAARVARPGEAVLLSPACASFDMFRDYKHRGEVFAAAVKALA